MDAVPTLAGFGGDAQVLDDRVDLLNGGGHGLKSALALFVVLETLEHAVGLPGETFRELTGVLFPAGLADGAFIESVLERIFEALGVVAEVLHEMLDILVTEPGLRGGTGGAAEEHGGEEDESRAAGERTHEGSSPAEHSIRELREAQGKFGEGG